MRGIIVLNYSYYIINCFLNLNYTSPFQATLASFILFSFIPSLMYDICCNDNYFLAF